MQSYDVALCATFASLSSISPLSGYTALVELSSSVTGMMGQLLYDPTSGRVMYTHELTGLVSNYRNTSADVYILDLASTSHTNSIANLVSDDQVISGALVSTSGTLINHIIDITGNVNDLSNSLSGYVTLGTDQTITGIKTFDGHVIINGTFSATSSVIIESEIISLSANYLTLNSNFTGSPTENAGIAVNRGDLSASVLQWTESIDRFQVGISGGISETLAYTSELVDISNSLSGYATDQELLDVSNSLSGYATDQELTDVTNSLSGYTTDLEFTNLSNSLSGYATDQELTDVSNSLSGYTTDLEFTNLSNSLSGYTTDAELLDVVAALSLSSYVISANMPATSASSGFDTQMAISAGYVYFYAPSGSGTWGRIALDYDWA